MSYPILEYQSSIRLVKSNYATKIELEQELENFAARFTQVNLVNKTDFDNKLISFNREITSNKTKYFEAQKKLNSLITKDYKTFLGRIYFTSNDGSQSTFIYQPSRDALELKKDKSTDYFLSWKPKRIINSTLKLLYTAFLHSIKLSG